jgi:hypothetical protein
MNVNTSSTPGRSAVTHDQGNLDRNLPTTNLTPAQQAKALRVIEDVHLTYHGKGGVRELVEEAEKKVQSASQHVYSLAVYASKQSDSLEDAAALFRELCSFAEAAYKEQHGVDSVREALPTWAVYKSNVLRGVTQFGLDPVDYRSERQFRIAYEAKIPKVKQRPSSRDPELRPPDDIAQFLETTPVRSLLRGPISDLVYRAEAIAYGKTSEAETVIKAAAEKLDRLVDRSKLN